MDENRKIRLECYAAIRLGSAGEFIDLDTLASTRGGAMDRARSKASRCMTEPGMNPNYGKENPIQRISLIRVREA
jgi:hypothetical protein